MSDPIYRDCCIRLNSKANKFLQAIALSNATITSSMSFARNFPESQMHNAEMHFRLRFSRLEDVEKFHSFGFESKPGEKVTVS